jgi:hypothetical protein
MNFLTSIYWIAKLNKTRSHWSPRHPGAIHPIPHVKERFWFKESYASLNSGYTQWVWNRLLYENLLERGKKSIHYDSMSITHAHKHEIYLCSMYVESYPQELKSQCYPTVWTLSWLQKASDRKTHEVTTFRPMFLDRRHTTTFMPIRKETLFHQSLCLKWSLELKWFLASQWCTLTHVSCYPYIHWEYSMNAEYICLRQQLTVDLGNSNFEQIPKLLTSKKHSWCVWFGTDYLTDTDSGNISQPRMRSPTQKHPQSGCVPWILTILV